MIAMGFLNSVPVFKFHHGIKDCACCSFIRLRKVGNEIVIV
jgi:hypothetical protein